MSIQSLGKDFDRKIKVHRAGHLSNIHFIEQLNSLLGECKLSISNDGNLSANLQSLYVHVKSIVAQMRSVDGEAQIVAKQLETSMAKVFRSDIDKILNTDGFACSGSLVNEVLAHHFLREGRFGLYEVFARETSVLLPEAYRNLFKEMFDILAELRQRRIQPAVVWAQQHRDALRACNSTLEFKLHKLHFLHLLQLRQYEDALTYGQTIFPPLLTMTHPPYEELSSIQQQQHGDCLRQVQRLMGCFLYLDRLETSPYIDLFSPTLWSDIEYAFTRDCCQFLGLSHDSPLFVTTQVGAVALPVLSKFFQVLHAGRGEWTQKDELPIDIPLTLSQNFHSTFVCPVSREQSNEDNPPMIMPCGHVICRESLIRLSKNGGKFKCPYCPSESTPAQARRIYF